MQITWWIPEREILYSVREDHTAPGEKAVNSLVKVAITGDDEGGQVIVSGNDFYYLPAPQPGWLKAGLADLESPQYALGWYRPMGWRIGPFGFNHQQ